MLSTHSGEFVAAACDRLGVELIHPPEHSAAGLAEAQAAWLVGEGKARGWRPVGSPVEAQAPANRGFVVVAVPRERQP